MRQRLGFPFWNRRRRITPPQVTFSSADPLKNTAIKAALLALTPEVSPPEILSALKYYSEKDKHERSIPAAAQSKANTPATLISSYDSAQAIGSALNNLKQGSLAVWSDDPMAESVWTKYSVNKAQAKEFYATTAELLVVVASPQIDVSHKLMALKRWDYSSVGETTSAKAQRSIMKLCGFDQDVFVQELRYLILVQALLQAADRQLAVAPLYKAVDALFKRLFSQSWGFQRPITLVEADQLFSDSVELVTKLVANDKPINSPVLIQNYRTTMISLRWSPLLRASVATLVVTALVFFLMVALQAFIGIAPLVALSLVNILASVGSLPQVLAAVTVAVTAVVALVTVVLPRYSPYPTQKVAKLIAQAEELSAFRQAAAVTNPLPEAGVGRASLPTVAPSALPLVGSARLMVNPMSARVTRKKSHSTSPSPSKRDGRTTSPSVVSAQAVAGASHRLSVSDVHLSPARRVGGRRIRNAGLAAVPASVEAASPMPMPGAVFG